MFWNLFRRSLRYEQALETSDEEPKSRRSEKQPKKRVDPSPKDAHVSVLETLNFQRHFFV
jgi:hypothetical protein